MHLSSFQRQQSAVPGIFSQSSIQNQLRNKQNRAFSCNPSNNQNKSQHFGQTQLNSSILQNKNHQQQQQQMNFMRGGSQNSQNSERSFTLSSISGDSQEKENMVFYKDSNRNQMKNQKVFGQTSQFYFENEQPQGFSNIFSRNSLGQLNNTQQVSNFNLGQQQSAPIFDFNNSSQKNYQQVNQQFQNQNNATQQNNGLLTPHTSHKSQTNIQPQQSQFGQINSSQQLLSTQLPQYSQQNEESQQHTYQSSQFSQQSINLPIRTIQQPYISCNSQQNKPSQPSLQQNSINQCQQDSNQQQSNSQDQCTHKNTSTSQNKQNNSTQQTPNASVSQNNLKCQTESSVLPNTSQASTVQQNEDLFGQRIRYQHQIFQLRNTSSSQQTKKLKTLLQRAQREKQLSGKIHQLQIEIESGKQILYDMDTKLREHRTIYLELQPELRSQNRDEGEAKIHSELSSQKQEMMLLQMKSEMIVNQMHELSKEWTSMHLQVGHLMNKSNAEIQMRIEKVKQVVMLKNLH